MLHLVVHLVGRRTHDQIADGVASHRNVRVGTQDVNATDHNKSSDKRLIRKHDTTARGVLDGVLRLAHLRMTSMT